MVCAVSNPNEKSSNARLSILLLNKHSIWNLKSSSSNGYEFTPHTIIVNAGEDVSSKIISLAQSASQTVCIVSANGEISSVTISQALTCGGSVTYEGRFQIISLTGYYTFSKSIGSTTRGLSILLSGSDGHVLGGGITGALIAASPVKLVVGSFNEGEESSKDVKQTEADPSKVLTGTWSVKSPLSHGTTSECSGGPGSPFNLSNGVCNNSMQQDMGTISF
ncbi:AT-hook motif nuclear-localized protein 10-like [Impatiens glandulifera]|uniref:AT-hook motif nuclear-localized protein 10-like n=1 Tax=Impatiens glandulifera TaxID=253017 RepID=UPI001FB13AD1|nr:AT-hook motif nuclear-localized protein 10-like [Impatiens glandulifera]